MLCLLAVCVVWGMGFNWNKQGQALLGERLSESFAEPTLAMLGPAAFLAARFVVGSLLWMAVFPRSVCGWSRATVRGGALGGGFLAAGMLLQHYGLSYTSESLSAFLTSLCVLFTPILAVRFLGHRVSAGMWGAVACATVGVALMTLFREEAGFDCGALLGLLCAVAFSGHILVIDAYGKREDPLRFTLAQFLFGTLFFVAFLAAWPGGSRLFNLSGLVRTFASRELLVWLLLVSTVGTVFTFGVMFRYQPRTSPTRAALIYLSEPIFATAYAWLVAGRTIALVAGLGAVLIIGGNVLAELLARKGVPSSAPAGRTDIVQTIVD